MSDSRILKVSYVWSASEEMIPFIRLQGKWLKEAGFAIGTRVKLTCSGGRLVLEVVQEPMGQENA